MVEISRKNQKRLFPVMLTKAGYALQIADNGQIAKDMYQNDSSFDIILMDCMDAGDGRLHRN
ncbi:hypothetical protein O9993_21330 [Vibrio lentus]|nr:hypothetical protein [Vibrio lentus]